MLDDTSQSAHEVWGIPIPISPKGSRNWPATIKQMALRKISEGARASDVATEIGITQSLIYKWVNSAKDRTEAPDFVEVVAPSQTAKMQGSSLKRTGQSVCVFRLNGTELEIPSDFPPEDLVGIVRAIKAATS